MQNGIERNENFNLAFEEDLSKLSPVEKKNVNLGNTTEIIYGKMDYKKFINNAILEYTDSRNNVDKDLLKRFDMAIENTSEQDLKIMYDILKKFESNKEEIIGRWLNQLSNSNIKKFRDAEIVEGYINTHTLDNYQGEITSSVWETYQGGIIIQFPKNTEKQKRDEVENYFKSKINRVTVELVDDVLGTNEFSVIPHAKYGVLYHASGGIFSDRMAYELPPELSEVKWSEIKGYLDKIKIKDNVSILNITAPKGVLKDIINKYIEENYKDYPHTINIKEASGLKSIRLEHIETIEESKSFDFEIENLSYNMLANPEELEELLNKNAELKAILNDPNYKVNNLLARGYASYKKTNRLPSLEFAGVKNLFPAQNKGPDGRILDQTDGGIYSNNVSLADDRSAAIVALLYNKGKINNKTNVHREYAVIGETDLTHLSEKEQEKIFSKYQKTNFTIEYTKREEKTVEGISVPAPKRKYAGYIIKTSNEKK